MLIANDLAKRFGGVAAVDTVSLRVPKAAITALIGPNGAGKTTVFNLLSGTIAGDGGSIELGGVLIGRLPAEMRARRGLSRTFQLTRPFRNLTVREHLLLAMQRDDDRLWPSLRRGHKEDVTDDALCRVLDRVGLDASLDAQAADLSYGQGKLLGLAMAIAHPHEVLLLDEPVAGVNPVLRQRIAETLRALRGEGETIFLIEHDMSFVMSLADHVIVMDRGQVIAQGTPHEVTSNPAVLSAYLGEQL